MKVRKLPKGTKVTVVGDIHEHPKHFDKLLRQLDLGEQHKLVSLGDIYDKGYGLEAAESITDRLKELVDKDLAYVIRGNHEQKRINRGQISPGIEWFARRQLALMFLFYNQTKLTIVHGGVTPYHTYQDLRNNVETLYIRTLDEGGSFIPLTWKEIDGCRKLVAVKEGKPWHEHYDGRFGYIISGHDSQEDGEPKFYAHSCNIDTKCYRTGILTAITYGERGRERLIRIEDEPADPEL